MIEVSAALLLIGFGAFLMLCGIVAGCVIDMRYLNRKLLKPVPRAAPITRQIPAVKP